VAEPNKLSGAAKRDAELRGLDAAIRKSAGIPSGGFVLLVIVGALLLSKGRRG